MPLDRGFSIVSIGDTECEYAILLDIYDNIASHEGGYQIVGTPIIDSE